MSRGGIGLTSGVALGLLLIAGLWWGTTRAGHASVRPEDGPGAGADARDTAARVSLPSTGPISGGETADTRRSLETPTEAAGSQALASGAAQPPAELVRSVRGIVVDAGAHPVSGIRVLLEPTELAATTDGAGRFELGVTADVRGGELLVESDDWALVRKSLLNLDGFELEHHIVVLPAVRLTGRVVDDAGTPLPGASLRVRVGREFERDFPWPLDRNVPVEPRARADAEGRFVFAAAPGSWGAVAVTVHASLDGYRGAQAYVAGFPTDVTLVLEAERVVRPELHGSVLSHRREPLPGARVRLGEAETETDAEGGFRLPLDESLDASTPLVAAKAGHGTRVLAEFGAQVAEHRPEPPPTVTLVLPEQSFSITGRVLEVDGTGLADWSVRLVEGTPLESGRMPPPLAESLVHGADSVTTDGEGRFTLEGLLERAYDVRAYDPETLRNVVAVDVLAGTRELELRCRADQDHERLAGRVVGRDGTPVAGVTVSLAMFTARRDFGAAWVTGRSVLTDAAGAFSFMGVPRAGVHVDLGGEAILPTRHELDESTDVRRLRIEVERRCHFRLIVRGADPDRLRFALEDDQGRARTVYTFRGAGWGGSSVVRLKAAQTPLRAVGEDARVLVLYRGDEVVARRPVRLDPLQATEIRIELP